MGCGKYSKPQISEEVFNVDVNNDGLISREELRAFIAKNEKLYLMLSVNLNIPADQCRDIATDVAYLMAKRGYDQTMSLRDLTSSTRLRLPTIFQSFLNFLDQPKGQQEFFHRTVFAVYDLDMSGYIEPDELDNFLNVFYEAGSIFAGDVRLPQKATLRKEVMRQLDTNGDGKLEFSELRTLISGGARAGLKFDHVDFDKEGHDDNDGEVTVTVTPETPLKAEKEEQTPKGNEFGAVETNPGGGLEEDNLFSTAFPDFELSSPTSSFPKTVDDILRNDIEKHGVSPKPARQNKATKKSRPKPAESSDPKSKSAPKPKSSRNSRRDPSSKSKSRIQVSSSSGDPTTSSSKSKSKSLASSSSSNGEPGTSKSKSRRLSSGHDSGTPKSKSKTTSSSGDPVQSKSRSSPSSSGDHHRAPPHKPKSRRLSPSSSSSKQHPSGSSRSRSSSSKRGGDLQKSKSASGDSSSRRKKRPSRPKPEEAIVSSS